MAAATSWSRAAFARRSASSNSAVALSTSPGSAGSTVVAPRTPRHAVATAAPSLRSGSSAIAPPVSDSHPLRDPRKRKRRGASLHALRVALRPIVLPGGAPFGRRGVVAAEIEEAAESAEPSARDPHVASVGCHVAANTGGSPRVRQEVRRCPRLGREYRGARWNRAERPAEPAGDPSNLIRVTPAEGAGMASVVERLGRALEHEAPTWGIRPVPPERRLLRGFDFAILWGDLSVGLLVILTGALLVPALGLPTALGAIAVGSLIGCVPLALVGLAGAREGVPGMVLFRPVLGIEGSYLPSVLNIVTLVGWTGFEFWAMSLVANEVSARTLHFSSYWLWLGLV